MHEAMVPAAPPDRRLNNFILDAVMVRVATMVEPPRQLDLPPRNILVVELVELPPNGMFRGDALDSLLLFVPHLLDWVG